MDKSESSQCQDKQKTVNYQQDLASRALELHEELKGKLRTELAAPIEDLETLSLVYSPGVAEPCKKIAQDEQEAYRYTAKGKTVAVISDGSAVLGLGNIGPAAAMPVMEGKCCLFKKFAGLNAVPLVLDTQDSEELIATIKHLAPSFGGINLEDISAPRCIEIERRLIDELNIPVFHDDQHGTAIVVTAALINALKLVRKSAEDCVAVISGTGAAGSSIIHMIKHLGIKNIYAFNSKGILNADKPERFRSELEKELAELTNTEREELSFEESFTKADIFIGVSAKDLVSPAMVRSMRRDPIIFALANPDPEIAYAAAREAGARVVGTGRSDYPNQINNVLAFPGLFKGALESRAQKITFEMKFAAAQALAQLVSDEELAEEYVIPSAFDKRVAQTLADKIAVFQAASLES